MATGREEMVGVLAAHQMWCDDDGAARGCSCGEMFPDDLWKSPKPLEEQEARWMASHQADMLAAAGINPFRPNHATEDVAAASAACTERDTWVDETTRPHRRVIRPCRRTRNHPGSHEALNTDGTPHRWRREETKA